MIDKHPAIIARCVDVADVIAAVNAARDGGMLLAVRGGAHNGAGLGTCDGGLVVDLSPMKGVFVDAGAQDTAGLAVAAPGATWITPPVPTGWRRRVASSRQRAWAD
ncbi:FAD-binding protein [Cupriavidus basilensis]